MNPMIYEWIVIRKFADQVCKRVCRRVIADLRRMTSTLSGDDSPLKNAWDEICVQVQFEESTCWEVYEATIDVIIEAEVDSLPEHELAAVWFQTSEGEEWGFTDCDDRKEPNIDQQGVIELIRDLVLSKAGDYTNPRIRKYRERFE